MSRITSFEIIAPRRSAGELVRAVIAHLAEEDRARLQRALDIGTEQIMRNVDRNGCESREDAASLCLTFLFAPDAPLRAFELDSELPSDPATGRVAVGCLWCDFYLGAHYVQFCAVAPVSSISELFFESQSVRDSFIDMAKQTPGATLVLGDDWLDRYDLIWRAPDATDYARSLPEAADTNLVDRCCLEVLNAIECA
ncbi:MAG: hypothetical protein PHQ60_16470 [Sideroxydans sp.]|nr:hypothetical protein [Sideroxydans sp.]